MNHAAARAMMGAAVVMLGCPAWAGDIATRIESCVSSGAIEFSAIDQHVTLDADDHERVYAEMQQRYPVLAQHGFPVSRILLWQKTGGDALFIALLEHPTKPNESCFTATFAAARFAGLAELKRKYLRPELVS
jgi:hypothetical protein